MTPLLKPAQVDRAWIAADPLTALVSSVIALLAVFNVWSKLGLTADQVAQLGGVLATLGAAARTVYNQSRASRSE